MRNISSLGIIGVVGVAALVLPFVGLWWLRHTR